MVKTFVVLLLLTLGLASACSAPVSFESPTRTPLLTPTLTPSGVTRLDANVQGVNLAVDVPPGWEGRATDEGLMLAEHFDPMDSALAADGIQVHIFVHSAAQMDLPEGNSANSAWNLLSQVRKNPNYVGTAETTEPSAFEWDGHDAAYYLLNDGSGSVALLMAVLVRDPMILVVSNISAPESRHNTIRPLLPDLFRTFTINGQSMSLGVLESLPDPLAFPTYVSKAQ